ncbi:6,7-dimethyl-8-ribityllumazine synthase [Methanomassiliicoccus luminyensis]|jgi:6,7-dimethyl-8-ribityllumazine synthase|uniref:6,7-dimethyl-8-ribityllumazine synthase n=1 Tax=Methanomassiliicoccus luminyensis TaxID=1080712 RepID=UPI0003813019|nr:6,7-dimethyl-8-ribityllumazine synthase [Methanomassiliicoccus luminyensis]
MKRYNIGIVVSEFNFDITSMMLERAKAHAAFLDVNVSKVIYVPGVYDIPLGVKKLVEDKDIDGVVTLGAVIEGETEHDQIVIQHAARKIIDLSLQYDKPVSLGISGPGMTRLQAEERIEKGRDALEACVKLLKNLG